MKDNVRYPYLEPYCDAMGSFAYYREAEAEKLAAMNAPRDAYSSKYGGGCYQLRDMRNQRLKEGLECAAGVNLADLLAEEADRLRDHAEDMAGDHCHE
jgi:hypothetical protein